MEPLPRVLRHILALMALMTGFALVVLVLARSNETIHASGEVRPARTQDVRSPIAGIVSQVRVREGDRVDSGQVLITLDAAELLSQLREETESSRQTCIRLEALQNEIDSFRTRGRDAQLAEARSSLAQAEIRLRQARERLERETALAADNLSSAENVRSSRHAYDLATAEFDFSRSALSLQETELRQQEGRDRSDLICLRSELAQAGARIEELRRRLKAAQITAPMDGQILSADLERLPGQHIDAGQSLLIVADPDQFEFVGYLRHVDEVKVRAGQSARLTLEAYPPRRSGICIGRVDAVSLQPVSAAGGSYFTVHISIRPPEATPRGGSAMALKLGLRGTAEIVIRPDVTLLALLVGGEWPWNPGSSNPR